MIAATGKDSGDHLEHAGANSKNLGASRGLLGCDLEEVNRCVQVVSLGSYCGVKMSLMRLGLGEAHMPLDWMHCSVEGILEWMKTDFAAFCTFTGKLEVQLDGADFTVYRSRVHSMWHDDIEDFETR